ncbi:CfrBI family restriction endonuclease [Acinetobacter baumannii]|uniref:CfrBI family restriction endonuclease n=2 Tax=Acinetobacter baumannii TaxID=470 RepID=A0AA44XXN2_ACIBA|nr:CfrBI family restriction endonuclease [Acinetobacter baumannii]ATY42683.1 CfrBI restriction endonuclease [Acinetobacter baumannii AB307-0294]EKA75273.1 CfrBI restriction endonuclease [Acinetobacter baumannii WC-692]MDC5324251.1 CfrBI family restriction endonuclease [Acinetobacter baumannii]MDC5594824.1 CfrBI family restriction endonuclease [Acinetobacter baumannii]MDV7370494.1 CfrBI family restriction endonuclease [Acinetobacter baumannii]
MNLIEIPEELSGLAKLSKQELVEELGTEVFRDVLLNIFLGKNVRNFTEALTRNRLLQSNIALWKFFCEQKKLGISPLDLINIAKEKLLNAKLSPKDRAVYEWLVAMTNKQTQNVLRKSHDKEFEDLTQATLEMLDKELLECHSYVSQGVKLGEEISFTFKEMCWISLVLGSQTLTIRGSEKSLHGKYFEKLILGSIFQIFGLKLLEIEDISQNGFWLSSQKEDRREADGTIVNDAVGIRVDIGFIGPGNSEITLDKVSRFTKFDEISGKKYEMSTIVIVDTLGEKSKARELAKAIEGEIICMSDPNWVFTLAKQISEKLSIKDPLKDILIEDLENYLSEKLKLIDLDQLINY